MPVTNSTLDKTMERLHVLYKKHALEPGIFVKAGLKQGCNVVIGTHGQCGMAMSFARRDDVFGPQRLDPGQLQTFIGSDLWGSGRNLSEIRKLAGTVDWSGSSRCPLAAVYNYRFPNE